MSMGKKVLVVLGLAACALVASGVLAHEGHSHSSRVMGTISAFHAPMNHLEVETATGQAMEFSLNDRTRILAGSSSATPRDLRVRQRVLVTFVGEDGVKTATEVRVSGAQPGAAAVAPPRARVDYPPDDEPRRGRREDRGTDDRGRMPSGEPPDGYDAPGPGARSADPGWGDPSLDDPGSEYMRGFRRGYELGYRHGYDRSRANDYGWGYRHGYDRFRDCSDDDYDDPGRN